jgi:hypothetical protein
VPVAAAIDCAAVQGCIPYATPAQTVAGTATALVVNPADLFARENIAAQTGLGLVLSAIPAPTASQSNWGTNTLGETLHYMPGVGWKVVDGRWGSFQPCAGGINIPANSFSNLTQITMPRAGVVSVSAEVFFTASAGWTSLYCDLFKNGAIITNNLLHTVANNSGHILDAMVTNASVVRVVVAAGDVISAGAQISSTAGVASGTSMASAFRGLRVQYIN